MIDLLPENDFGLSLPYPKGFVALFSVSLALPMLELGTLLYP